MTRANPGKGEGVVKRGGRVFQVEEYVSRHRGREKPLTSQGSYSSM